MSDAFIDTDIIIRLLTGDDPLKQAAAAELFEKIVAGDLVISAPDTVIADAIHVLSSTRLYRLPRGQTASLLRPIVSLNGFRVANRTVVLRALDLYETTNLDWGDTMIVAAMERDRSQTLYSYDRHIDRIPGIDRREP